MPAWRECASRIDTLSSLFGAHLFVYGIMFRFVLVS